jgi:hypothetical protein
MISVVILSTVATVKGLQQYASEGLRTRGIDKRKQRVDSDIDGQLKVGPLHQGSARAPATNGES